MEIHKSFLAQTKKGHIDLLFLGDSITQGWNENTVWQRYYGPRHAANFGIGGDRTEHVLWRITEGKELEGIKPKAAVLTHGQLACVVTNHLCDLLPGTTADDGALVVAPLSHGAGIHQLTQVARGARTVLLASERLDCEEAFRLIGNPEQRPFRFIRYIVCKYG